MGSSSHDGSAAGFERLSIAAENHPAGKALIAAFSKLEEARQRLEVKPDCKDAEDLVWDANIDILRHEQEYMVQPRFDKLDRGFSQVLSLFSTMHYQAGGRCKKAMLPGAFVAFSLFQAEKKVFPPSLTNLDQRWDWIVNGILPGFRCFDGETRKINKHINKLIGH